jgi:hypothetical protein
MLQRFRLVLRSMYGENAGNRVALRRHDQHHRVMGIAIGPAGLVESEAIAGQPGQAGHRPADRAVKTRLRRMQYRPGLLEGFLAKPGLDLGNFHN